MFVGEVKFKCTNEIARKNFESEIEGISLKYFPFWVALVSCEFQRPILGSRKLLMGVVVDAVRGGVGGFEGEVKYSKKDIPPELKYEPNITQTEARALIEKFAKQATMFKYKKVPIVEIRELILFYKPIWVVTYLKNGKKYYGVVDGENGEVNYYLSNILNKLGV